MKGATANRLATPRSRSRTAIGLGSFSASDLLRGNPSGHRDGSCGGATAASASHPSRRSTMAWSCSSSFDRPAPSVPGLGASIQRVFARDAESKEESPKAISISDIMGRIIFSLNNPPEKTNINISGFPDGIYYLRVQNGQTVRVLKVMKE